MDIGRAIRRTLYGAAALLISGLALPIGAHVIGLNLDDLITRNHLNGVLAEKAPGWIAKMGAYSHAWWFAFLCGTAATAILIAVIWSSLTGYESLVKERKPIKIIFDTNNTNGMFWHDESDREHGLLIRHFLIAVHNQSSRTLRSVQAKIVWGPKSIGYGKFAGTDGDAIDINPGATEYASIYTYNEFDDDMWSMDEDYRNPMDFIICVSGVDTNEEKLAMRVDTTKLPLGLICSPIDRQV